jgi:hypothetical protein
VDERRRAERHLITIPVSLKHGSGITRDVSGLGVYFTSPYPFESGEKLDFVLQIPGSIHVRCIGHVVRSDFDREAMSYGAAVTIDDYDVVGDAIGEAPDAQIVLRELEEHHPKS